MGHPAPTSTARPVHRRPSCRRWHLLRWWWTGVTQPAAAFVEAWTLPAPQWSVWVVVGSNLAITLGTVLPFALLDRPPLPASWLTFLPTHAYLQAEVFFLMPLRVAVWLLASAVLHVGLRLAHQPSDFDAVLTIGGVGALVVTPVVIASDWLLTFAGGYGLSLTAITHLGAAVWGLALTALGLHVLLRVRWPLALGLATLSTLVSIPLLAIFAR